MPDIDPSPTDGAVLLQSYLRSHGESLYAFCKRAGLEYAYVHRVLRGTDGGGRRVTVNFAKRVHDATDASVPWHAWVTDEQNAEPKPAA